MARHAQHDPRFDPQFHQHQHQQSQFLPGQPPVLQRSRSDHVVPTMSMDPPATFRNQMAYPPNMRPSLYQQVSMAEMNQLRQIHALASRNAISAIARPLSRTTFVNTSPHQADWVSAREMC